MTHPQAPQDLFDGTAARQLEPRFAADDFFDQQPTSTSALPDPRPLIENLTRLSLIHI